MLSISQINIYVGNLSFQASDADVLQVFEKYGKVTCVNVIRDKQSGRSRGFAFVEMADRTEGERAIAELNGIAILGREIEVNEAKSKGDKG